MDAERKLVVARGEGPGELGEDGEGVKYELVVGNQPLGREGQHSECSH